MTSAAGNTDYSELVQQFCSVTGEGDGTLQPVVITEIHRRLPKATDCYIEKMQKLYNEFAAYRK